MANEVYQTEAANYNQLEGINETRCEMFKYKYETVLAAQYINPSEIDIKNRFDHLPKSG